RVYWAAPSTLIVPSAWHRVGSTVIALVPPGRVLTVSDAITWPAASIPGNGQYSFIAMLGIGAPPAAPPAKLGTLARFVRMVRANETIAWRTFFVVGNAGGRQFVELAFVVPGTPQEGEFMPSQIATDPPHDARRE